MEESDWEDRSFSDTVAWTIASVLSHPMDGIMAHHAPSTTSHAWVPPSG